LAINRKEYRIIQSDVNPNKKIGIMLPFGNGKSMFRLTNTTEQQLYYNLINLLLTNIGERYHQPAFGTNLRDMLFENYTEEVADKIKGIINKAISFWLPGIDVINISVTDSINSNIRDIMTNSIYIKMDFIIDPNANHYRTITLFANSNGSINVSGN